MAKKTEAIVLTKTKYGDSSFIVNLYSLEYGRFASIIKISRSGKSNNLRSNLFFPLNIIETEVELRSTRSVQTVKYCNRLDVFNNISCDIYKSCIAQFIAEVVSKTVKEEEPHDNLYQFLKETIYLLEEIEQGASNIHLLFLKEFSKILGFGITNNFCNETPYFNFMEGMFLPVYASGGNSLDKNYSKIISGLLKKGYSDISEINLSYQYRKKILEYFLRYYQIHMPNMYEIKSLKVLNEVFTG